MIMCGKKELSFSIFMLYSLADKWKMSPAKVYKILNSTGIIKNPDAAAVTMVWSYIGELIFNMLVLVGAVKMSDRVVREMMGL